MTIRLHIGLHKTGTTSIQSLLSQNQDVLARHGTLYLRCGRTSNGHHRLAQSLASSDRTKFQTEIEAVKAEIRAAYAKGIDNILISSEIFCRIGLNKLQHLRESLSDFEIRILLFVRRQDEMMVSHYCEFVKRGHTARDFTDFVWTWNQDRFWYLTYIRRLEEIFGKDAIKVASYNLHNSEVFARFCKLAEISWLLNDAEAVLEARANPALDRHLLKCLFYLRCNWRQEGHDVGTFESEYLIPFANFINQRFPERPREQFHGFGEHLAEMYMARFREENRAFSTSVLNVDDAFPSRRVYPPIVESLLPSAAEASEMNRLVLSFLTSCKGPGALTALADGR